MRRRVKGEERVRRARDPRQGGGKFSRVAPAIRRARRRQANAIAKASRRANR